MSPEELFGWTSGKNETRDDFRAMGEIKSRPAMRVRLKRLAVYLRRMNVLSPLRAVPGHTTGEESNAEAKNAERVCTGLNQRMCTIR
jgi:hypothetical protein